MNAETVYFQLTLTAPVHIGCGEVYEPMGFVVDEESRELISFQPVRFLGNLSSAELTDFSTICQLGTIGSIQRLYKFMRRHREYAQGDRITLSGGFLEHYSEVLERPENRFQREVTQFTIERTAFNPFDNTPVIPGSSLKGAIRTAILNERTQGKSLPRFTGKNRSRDLQEHLLKYSFRNIATDPFRMIKLSDFVPVGEVKRKVCYAVSFSKKDGTKKIPQLLEVIEPGSKFWGSITILPQPGNIERPVRPTEIIDALQHFYGFELQREKRELEKIGGKPVNIDGGVIPLRLGRHSGAECVTVNGHRDITVSPPGVKPLKYDKRATTIWLASSTRSPSSPDRLQPMGWVYLAPLTDGECNLLRRQQEEHYRMQESERRQQMEEKHQQEELRLQKARDNEEQCRLEDDRKQAEQQRIEALQSRWEAMSELEQYLAIIHGEEIALSLAPDKDPLRDIWPEFEKAGADSVPQRQFAEAFCKVWREDPARWRKKSCLDGQWKKVEILVKILDVKHEDIKKLDSFEQEIANKIEALKDWGQYKNSRIEREELTLNTACMLEKKFKEWNCNVKKAKNDKQQAWKMLRKTLQQLRKGAG